MNGIYNPIVFYPMAVVLIFSAIFAVSFRNIFHSLLSAIILFFVVGVLFYVLGSEYNAIVQIAIYGLAVPIILGLAIMFTNLDNKEKEKNKISKIKFLLFLFAGLFILTTVYIIMTSLLVNPTGFDISENVANTSIQVINSFAQGIFVKYVWAFELVSLILTIIVAGLTLFKTKEGLLFYLYIVLFVILFYFLKYNLTSQLQTR